MDMNMLVAMMMMVMMMMMMMMMMVMMMMVEVARMTVARKRRARRGRTMDGHQMLSFLWAQKVPEVTHFWRWGGGLGWLIAGACLLSSVEAELQISVS